MVQLFRIHPGLAICLALVVVGGLVCGILAWIMWRSGASLRPIGWFAGFFALIVIPQFLGHLWKARSLAEAVAPQVETMDSISTGTAEGGKPEAEEIQRLLGPDADPHLTTDARNLAGGVFQEAAFARFAILSHDETVLLARLTTASAAEKAWLAYLQSTGLANLPGQGKGDSRRGYAVTRPTGDRLYALQLGTLVGIWTAPTDRAIRERMKSGGFQIPKDAPLESDSTESSGVSKTPRSPWLIAGLGLVLAIYSVGVVAYFFKGAAWAASSPALPVAKRLTAAELSQRLQAINQLDVPFRIDPGEQQGEWLVSWRFADARWIDWARVHQLKRTMRIRMRLDETTGVVRSTDQWASLESSMGISDARLRWESAVGIVLFQYQHERVVGLQLDEHGQFKPSLSYAYTFNLHEMKAPLVKAVTQAGWQWRPVIWDGPPWMRWLTE